MPFPTASARPVEVRPVRTQASHVRSLASQVRRVASPSGTFVTVAADEGGRAPLQAVHGRATSGRTGRPRLPPMPTSRSLITALSLALAVPRTASAKPAPKPKHDGGAVDYAIIGDTPYGADKLARFP